MPVPDVMDARSRDGTFPKAPLRNSPLSPRFVRERKPKFESDMELRVCLVSNQYWWRPSRRLQHRWSLRRQAMHKDWEQRLKDSPVAADTLVWAEVADTWAVAAGAAGITWAWVEAGEAAVLAGPAAGGVEV